MIYKAWTMFNNKIFMFGDTNQCEPVEKGSQIHYDYLISRTVRQMRPEVVTLNYIEGCSRYDATTHKVLRTFLKHGKVAAWFPPIDRKLYTNICFLNSTRRTVNKKCCDKFCKGKKKYTVNFKYDNKIETYDISVSMPILATN